MSTNISVSLVIPFYNGSKYFDKALKSALNQTTQFEEIIVVNDGSSENESVWLRGHTDIGTVKLIETRNGGQGAARNAGINAAKSDYICFLDQDDILYQEHAELLTSAMCSLSKPRGWVYGNFSTCDANGRILSRMSYPNSGLPKPQNLINFLDHDIFVLPSATIFSRLALLDVGGFDAQFRGYEDDDLIVRLFLAGYSYEYLPREVYIWRMHDSQTSSTFTMCQSRLRFVKKWSQIEVTHAGYRNIIVFNLYKRFRNTVILDYFCSNEVKTIELRKNIAKEFLSLFISHFSGTQKVKVVLLRLAVTVFPKSFGNFCLSNALTKKFIKGITRVLRVSGG